MRAPAVLTRHRLDGSWRRAEGQRGAARGHSFMLVLLLACFGVFGDRENSRTILADAGVCAYFEPIHTKQLNARIVRVFRRTALALDAAGIPWTICAGTLLGFVRHHGTDIPWDDDVDLVVPDAHIDNVSRALKAADATLCTSPFWAGQKSFMCDEEVAPHRFPWKYPFIDIFQHSKSMMPANFVYGERHAFFNGLRVRVPENATRIACESYSCTQCKSASYDHLKEQSKMKSIERPCLEVRTCSPRSPLHPASSVEVHPQAHAFDALIRLWDTFALKHGIRYSITYGTYLGWLRTGNYLASATHVDVHIGQEDADALASLRLPPRVLASLGGLSQKALSRARFRLGPHLFLHDAAFRGELPHLRRCTLHGVRTNCFDETYGIEMMKDRYGPSCLS